MTRRFDLLIRNARSEGGGRISIGIAQGCIAAIGADLAAGGPEYDARGMVASAGLHDHHLHLLATAARMESVDLAGCPGVDEAVARLRSSAREPGSWVRAIGYDERLAGVPDHRLLDSWLPDHPLRMQDRTGAYWFLNSAAIAKLGAPPYPPCVECGANGAPTGSIWRGDAWLRERIGGLPPSLKELGAKLAGWGVTAVTDAGASNGDAEAKLLAGAMPQRLTIMGTEALSAGPGYMLGPVKLLLDENDLPPLEATVSRVVAARTLGRKVAAHCVTLGELVYYLEALANAGGAQPGDRVEHGGMIAETLIGNLRTAGLTVVTQPNFIHDRGDRYIAQMQAFERGDLYRLGSLMRGGVRVLGGMDAPYGNPNPWIAIRAATDRRTAGGAVIGASEAIDRAAALSLYRSGPLVVGAPADLILYDWSTEPGVPAKIGLTLIGGLVAYEQHCAG